MNLDNLNLNLDLKKIDVMVICAIFALVIIQCVAMHYGINGTFRAMIAGAICGLAGWRIPISNENVLKIKTNGDK